MQGLKKLAIGGLIAGAFAPFGATAQAPVKVGVVAFLSGPAAAPFGVPAKNAADFVIDELNAGTHAIYVYGEISYRDAFGKERYTRYRLMHITAPEIIGTRINLLFCHNGNEAT